MKRLFESNRYKDLTPREKFVLNILYIIISRDRICESVDERLEKWYCDEYGDHKSISGYSNNVDYRVSRKLTALSERRPRLFNRRRYSGYDYYGETTVHYYGYTMNDYQKKLVESVLKDYKDFEPIK